MQQRDVDFIDKRTILFGRWRKINALKTIICSRPQQYRWITISRKFAEIKRTLY